MPYVTSSELLASGAPSARRTSIALFLIATVALAGDALLICPREFSAAHQVDHSWFRTLVDLMSLYGRFPTSRGVEIRDLFFYLGAACLAAVAGVRLLTTRRCRTLSRSALLDIRARAHSPALWWGLLLAASLLSSATSIAPRVMLGQTAIRAAWFIWWWTLAALLLPKDARRLAGSLVTILAVMAAIGLIYQHRRSSFASPVQFPLGNQLWMGACMLPGVFAAVGLLRGPRVPGPTGGGDVKADQRPSHDAATLARALMLTIALGVMLAVVILTRSRSAAVGLGAGIVTLAWMAMPRRMRVFVLVGGTVCALATAWYVQSFRPHSIRARLEHEWPYALVLWTNKAFIGNGDGAYSLLAGGLGREDQIDDPSVMSFDNEQSWVAHAHNEFLETLSDLGIVGLIALAAALVVTLRRAVRYADAAREKEATTRWLAIGLSAGLVAVFTDQFFENAMRNPGLPAFLLTIWAALWAVVRPVESTNAAADNLGSTRRPAALPRGLGALACASAIGLACAGIQNWRAIRAHRDAEIALDAGRFDDATKLADFAAADSLRPFQRLVCESLAIRIRTVQFANALASPSDASAPADAVLSIAEEALRRLGMADREAPRFLWLSRMRVSLCRNLALACHRRGDAANESDWQQALVDALERCRADDPFDADVVEELWRIEGGASFMDRLKWLRCLMRRGEIDGRFRQLFADLARHPGFPTALNDLFHIAAADANRAPADWQDRLTPETFRIAALAKASMSQTDQAVDLANRAAHLYEEVGERLFAGRSAAMHEAVQYAFSADPTGDTERCLRDLAAAWAVAGGVNDPRVPIRGVIGWTRTDVLMAAGREQDAAQQVRLLIGDKATEEDVRVELAQSSLRLAAIVESSQRDLALRWASRAAELTPSLAAAHATMLRLALDAGNDAAARQALNHFEDIIATWPADRREGAERFLDDLWKKHPGSSIRPTSRPPSPASQP